MTETAQLADVVLPSASFAEKDGTFTNTERKVQRVRKAVPSPGEAREDWEIICDLSTRMGYPMKYNSAKEIMDEIGRVTPSYCGINFARLERDGIHWPCTGTDHPGTPCLHMDQFTCGLGVFHAMEWIPPAEVPDKEYPLYLTTGRVLYQYHTGTMTMKSDGLNQTGARVFRGDFSRRRRSSMNCKDGQEIKVSSRRGEIQAKAKISGKAVDGTVFIPFH